MFSATFVSNFVKLEIVVLEPLMRFTEKISKISNFSEANNYLFDFCIN
jgi:hypothetical protein